ncbi:MAG: UDP-N-acetylmuramate--alanine ligase [Pseudohongiellaceae bacterium]
MLILRSPWPLSFGARVCAVNRMLLMVREKGLPTRVHCVGVAGGGLSAFAGLLASCGHEVSGSDGQSAPAALAAAGVSLYRGHRAENLGQAQLLIRSAAVPDENVEVQAARDAGVPVLKYSEALGRLMATRQGLAVAGTHGKTSTTAMAAHLLQAAGAAPAWIIGGQPQGMAAYAWGDRGPMVVEACEYDRSFLNLSYDVALVTGITVDHLDCFGDWDGVLRAFGAFCAGLPDGGQLVLGPGVAEQLGSQLPTHCGVHSIDDLLPLQSARAVGGGWEAIMGPEGQYSLRLPVLARHDLDNLRCALVAASCCGVSLDRLLPGVESFAGVARRLQDLGEVSLPGGGTVRLIDDFAHHPDALQAALSTARAHFPGRRVMGVFQPHQVCRTEDLFSAFAQVLRGFDQVALCDIFLARDAHPERAESVCEALAEAAGPNVARVGPALDAEDSAGELFRPDDVCVVMGAGDIDGLAHRIVRAAARP